MSVADLDILALANDRLNFIVRFYERASGPFLEIKGKINRGRPPYVPKDLEDSEPEYLSEWIDCDDSVDVLGHCCLSMVQASLHVYIRDFVRRIQERYASVFPNLLSKLKKKGGWFEGYQQLFLEELRIDWAKSPAPLSILEEINLTRNDFEHPADIGTLSVRQSENHFRSFPESLFADEDEVAAFADPSIPEDERALFPWRLRITQDKLIVAVTVVRQFCSYLEDVWIHYPPK